MFKRIKQWRQRRRDRIEAAELALQLMLDVRNGLERLSMRVTTAELQTKENWKALDRLSTQQQPLSNMRNIYVAKIPRLDSNHTIGGTPPKGTSARRHSPSGDS